MIVALLSLTALADSAPLSVQSEGCPPRGGNEVVICGARPGESPYRIPKLPERYDPKKIRAETNLIPGVHARAHLETETRPDGYQANRLMMTLSTAF